MYLNTAKVGNFASLPIRKLDLLAAAVILHGGLSLVSIDGFDGFTTSWLPPVIVDIGVSVSRQRHMTVLDSPWGERARGGAGEKGI